MQLKQLIKCFWFSGVILLAMVSVVTAQGPELADLPPAGMDKVPGQYIVVLKDNIPDVPQAAAEITKRFGATAGHSYSAALKGFVIHLPQNVDPSSLRHDPRVQFVEQDSPLAHEIECRCPAVFQREW